MAQMATALSESQSQGKLPSQTVDNPKANDQPTPLVTEAHFPNWLKSKKKKKEKDIFEMFRKVEVNIPLGENMSAVIQRKMPQKCKDQGMFSISCQIGKNNIKRAFD
ncbi:hypothetical protein M5689_010830 [Euphorbia peplus]|nr:hypothetical protein M5689_010830 [Euphorbia peplus]